jgi:nicotinamide-nucleotide amidase
MADAAAELAAEAEAVAAVQALLAQCRADGLTLAVAEGDTGGVLLDWLTRVPGSAAVVLGGVVAYHDGLKTALLGVPEALIVAHGSVSAEAAEAMAQGVRAATGASIGVATTGIAGPGGARPHKPVGLAFVAVARADGVRSTRHAWSGDRRHNRAASALAALRLALADETRA